MEVLPAALLLAAAAAAEDSGSVIAIETHSRSP